MRITIQALVGGVEGDESRTETIGVVERKSRCRRCGDRLATKDSKAIVYRTV